VAVMKEIQRREEEETEEERGGREVRERVVAEQVRRAVEKQG
jgi:hypothetical protein